MALHVVPVAGNSFTAGDGNPKVLAAVKSGAFKLKLQAKQTAAGRDCRLELELGMDCDCGAVRQMKSEPNGNAKTVPKHKFAACLADWLGNERGVASTAH